MIIIGRRHFAFDSSIDLREHGMVWRDDFRGRHGLIHFTRFGRIVCMTLPKGRHVA